MPRQKHFRRKSFDLYKKVVDLRKSEHSYSEIRKETGLAKSTIQNWLTHSGLTLTKEHLQIRAKRRALAHVIATAASKITRAKRKREEVDLFVQSVKKYFRDPFFVAGIMLYESEGSKGSSNGFSNSDFRLIRVYIKFLKKYLYLNPEANFTFRLYIHEKRKMDLGRIVGFWSNKLLVDRGAIRISWKHNVVTENRINPDYVGQFEVRVKGFRNFAGKILAVSDIILGGYQRI